MGANLILPSSSPADDAEVVTKSCRFNSASSPVLSRTMATGDRQTFTISAWVKRSEFGTASRTIISANYGGATDAFLFSSGDKLQLYRSDAAQYAETSGLFRDPSAWYHIAAVVDTAAEGETNADCVKFFVNGVQETLTFSGSFVGVDFNGFDNNQLHYVGFYANSSVYWDGYLADFYFIDGSAVEPMDNFIETDGTTGQLKPKAYTTSLGTNGFHLDFKDDTDLGNDAAGSNNFTASGLVASDQMNDRPTNNYAVANALTTDKAVLSEGNLKSAGTDYSATIGTIGVSTGQWYWEVWIDTTSVSELMPYLGVTSLENDADGVYLSADKSWAGNGVYKKYTETSASADSGINGSAVWGFALDLDSGTKTLKIYKDDTEEYDDSTIPADTLLWPVAFLSNSGGGVEWLASYWNFGQDPTFAGNKSSGQDTSQSEFFYAPPAGYLALSTANLPDPDIKKGHKNFNTLLYDDGTGAKTFGAADNMQPDLVWVKSRGSTNDHKLTDSVRGVQESLESNTVDTEVTESSNVGVTVFGADGFTVGSSSSTTGPYADQAGTGMVGWGWKGGTAGSGGSGVDWAENFNATAGFSIIKWTGNDDSMADSSQTVSHSLEVAPDFIIAKNRTGNGSANGSWIVYHKDLTAGDFLKLDDAAAKFTPDTPLISSIGSSSVAFASDMATYNEALNYGGMENPPPDPDDPADTYIAYLFSEVEGYSKFGSYEGNNDDDGPFIWCGFKPDWLLIKRVDGATANWQLLDAKRNEANAVNNYLNPNTNGLGVTDTSNECDFLSNGVKIRSDGAHWNHASEYIFAAFASKPFKYATAR